MLHELVNICDYIYKHFNEVVSVDGHESAILELYIFSLLMYKFEDPTSNQIGKLLNASRDILYNLANCPLEIILSLKFVLGLLAEDEMIWESEKEYLSSFMYYLQIYGDP